MKFPEIPTDNLYKFMAISGITIVIISLLPFYHVHVATIDTIRLGGEIQKLDEQAIWITEDVEKLKEETDKLKKEVDKKLGHISFKEIEEVVRAQKPDSEMTKEQVEKVEDELNKIELKASEITNAIRKHKTLSIELKMKLNEQTYLNRVMRIESILFLIGALVGFLLSLTGFMLWYRKVQILQDRIIQKKAKYKET